MTESATTNQDNLSEQERANLLRLAAQARNRFARGAPKVAPKPAVSPEEYTERLKQALNKDRTLLAEVQEDTIKKSVEAWGSARLNATFAGATTDKPQILERLARLKAKRGLHKTSLVLYGDQMGRGKTWQAYAYLNEIIKQGIATPGQIISGTESSIVSAIANSGYERNDRTREMLKESHRIFFIDDVGQGYFFKEQNRHDGWYNLIDHVYSRQLTLILTTNLPFNDNGLGNWVGARAFDRLRSLVGDDGAVYVTGVNRREQVFRENEAEYRQRRS